MGMAKIKITDELNAEVAAVTANPNPITSAFGKYLTSPAANILLLPDFMAMLNDPLAAAAQNPLSLKIQFADNVTFGAGGNPELVIGAGITQNVNINAKAEQPLFPTDLWASPLVVKPGEGWLSLQLSGKVNLGVSGSASDLNFGITAGGSFQIEYFRRFTVDTAKPTVAEALSSVLSDFVLPADVSDLDAMQPGDIATVSGNGTVTLSGNVSVSVSPNPLASPNLPVVNHALTLNATASLDIAASYSVSGEYQIRVRKLTSNSVELGYYRKKGKEWSVSATASAGGGVSFGQTELLSNMLARLTDKAAADVNQLVQSSLQSDQIKQIQDAISNSIESSLKASVSLELTSATTDEAAFLYQIEASALDAVSSPAVQAALSGDLSRLTSLEKEGSGQGVIAPGVTMLRSIFTNVRDRKATLKLNLIGLLNFSSIFELIKKSQVVFEPITGELTINENITGTSIETLTHPAAQEKLRRLKFNSLLATTAYRASHSISSMQLTSSDIYFALNQNTNEHTMSDYLDGLIAVDLINNGIKHQLMAGFSGTGASTYLLRAEFSDAACDAMFLTATGQPRNQSEYENIGRDALQQLLLPGDHSDADKYRRDILASDVLWAQLKKAGQANVGQAVPELANDANRLNLVRSDYTAIMWWAESMASTAQKLMDVRTFVGKADPAALEDNYKFNSLRKDLQNHIADVVANSQLQFGLPFGLAALYRAAYPEARAVGLIVSPALTRSFASVVQQGATPASFTQTMTS
jgi:hypothetical protein